VAEVIGTAVNNFFGRFQHRLGIANTRRIAKAYNTIRYRSERAEVIEGYERRYDELFMGNDPGYSGAPRNKLDDGWVIDRSGNFPGLESSLAEAERLIEERGGQDLRGNAELAQQQYLFHLSSINELDRYPRLLDFGTSSEVLGTVADYMGMVPTIALNLPVGIRVFESTNRWCPPMPYNESQLYHRDIHDMPLVYAIVLARDATEHTGPWTFLPASVSARATRALNYQKWRQPYRVTDERMYEVVDPSERIVFTGKRGDVLFLDTSRCFHYGSRDAVEPGYRIMYAYTTRCRTDFRMMLYRQQFPRLEGDSALRRMVLGH
jgi:hypothetical protein